MDGPFLIAKILSLENTCSDTERNLYFCIFFARFSSRLPQPFALSPLSERLEQATTHSKLGCSRNLLGRYRNQNQLLQFSTLKKTISQRMKEKPSAARLNAIECIQTVQKFTKQPFSVQNNRYDYFTNKIQSLFVNNCPGN